MVRAMTSPMAAAGRPAPAVAPGGARLVLGLMALALGAGAMAGAVSHQVLGGSPHVADEVSYAFQGRVLAGARLALAPPPLPSLFGYENVILDGHRWVSKYPPGWPAMLALGWLVGVPWLAGPLALAAAVLAAGWLGTELHGPRIGLLAAGLLAVSPFALLMGAGWLAHTPALALGLGCLAALARARRPPRGRWLLMAGFMAGAAIAVRPVSAVALLLPALIWSSAGGRWRRAAETLGFLAARALEATGRLLFRGLHRVFPSHLLPSRFLGALGLAALAVFPLGRRLPREIEALSGAYHCVLPIPARAIDAAGVGEQALVFVAGSRSAYAPFLLGQHLPPGSGGRVFARDVPALRRAAAATWPRPETWRVEVRLRPLPGPNPYVDRCEPVAVTWQRLRIETPAAPRG
jgi:hypothetical protein